ncbi:MAG: heparinase II/III family protein [Rhodothalassiaceae bacterium]|nr:MAG: heparinase II/III family protein [Rhodothalassiaceae bacterium]
MTGLEALFEAGCEERRIRRPARTRRRRDWAMPWWVRLPGGERLYAAQLNGRHPLRLVGSPGAVLPGDARRGADWLAGRRAHDAERRPLADRRDPWADAALDPATAEALQRFSWLGDIARATREEEARALAQAWTAAWLKRFGRWGGAEAWHPRLVAARLVNWFQHAGLLLATGDLVYRSAVIDSMARQARHLALQLGRIPAGSWPGEDVAELAVALAMAGLLLPYGETWRRAGLEALNHHLYRSRDATGAPLSRRPLEAFRTLAALVALERCFRERGEDCPRWLVEARRQLAAFLLQFAFEDGWAHVHGLALVPRRALEQLLDEARVDLVAPARGERGGYVRLKARRTVVLFDGGPPPPAGFPEATAGLLAFEMADGARRIVVNMGPLVVDGSPLGAATAAHATIVVADRNACPVLRAGLGGGMVESRLWSGEAAEGHLAGARHDGYRDRFGLDVERRLLLARDGKLLIGEDALIAAEPGRAKAGAAATFAIRFHLHPDVEAIATQGGDRVLLRLGPDRAWAFALDAVEGVEDVALAIEDSLHLGADGPERTRQIVVTGRRAGDATRCRWQLGRVEG